MAQATLVKKKEKEVSDDVLVQLEMSLQDMEAGRIKRVR